MSDEKTVCFEAYIETEDMLLSEVCLVTDKIEHLLKEKEGIYYVTLQVAVDKCCDKRLFK
ncbi:hypothetical protein [uncultured Acetobacterium sp.]|uniref:hypothetical protein n=1 Tax=uncultured Acetobacterium sp. TaxID=217139 RepID=UPI0025DE2F5E|nr:hypothetical protein [uncultured Acetobacterium sp.]